MQVNAPEMYLINVDKPLCSWSYKDVWNASEAGHSRSLTAH